MVDQHRDDDSSGSGPSASPMVGSGPASRFTRTLSASERAWAGPNPSSWANLVRAIRLRRAVEPDAFRPAIAALQREFAELRCCLVAKPGKQAVLQECAATIPVRVRVGADDSAVARYLKEELRTPVGCDGSPLMRAELFTADNVAPNATAATIVLTVHHVIIDRNSSKTLIERLLAALDGAVVAAKPGSDRIRHDASLLGATRATWKLLRERSFSAAGRRRAALNASLSDTTQFTVVRLDEASTRTVSPRRPRSRLASRR